MVDVRFRPATGTEAWRAAVARSAIAALPPEVTPHTADAVWRRLDAGGIAAVLDALTGAFGTSLTAIPPFALAVVEGDGVRVAVRGPVEIVAETAAGAQAVSGAGVATWTERFIPGVGRLTIALSGDMDDAAALPIESGVVPVEALTVTIDAAVSAAAREPAAGAAAAAAVEPGPVEPAAVEPDAVEPELASAAVDPEPAEPAVLSPLPQLPPVPPLPPMPADADTWLPAPAVPVSELPAMSERTLAPEPDGAPDAPTPETPWEATIVRAAGVDAEPAPGAHAQLGDHDGATISVAEARALRAAGGAAPGFDPTDEVPARRPARGRIRISDGNVVELERTVVIGRRPRSTRPSDADLPALVAVDSPQQDISRSHVEIRAEGEHVLATDLGTTNGTVLLRGGNDPVRLHPHEPTMVVDGDVLDIGDGVTIAFEDLP